MSLRVDARSSAGVGFATARACVRLWLGVPPERSGVNSAGNGPAMRSAILGAVFAREPERRREFVRASSRLTHLDPRAETAALAVAAPGTAAASVMVEASVPELAREADVVARGRVASAESRVSGDGMRLFTVVTLEVAEAWKGEPGKTVQIQVPAN